MPEWLAWIISGLRFAWQALKLLNARRNPQMLGNAKMIALGTIRSYGRIPGRKEMAKRAAEMFEKIMIKTSNAKRHRKEVLTANQMMSLIQSVMKILGHPTSHVNEERKEGLRIKFTKTGEISILASIEILPKNGGNKLHFETKAHKNPQSDSLSGKTDFTDPPGEWRRLESAIANERPFIKVLEECPEIAKIIAMLEDLKLQNNGAR